MPLSLTLPECRENAVYTEIKHEFNSISSHFTSEQQWQSEHKTEKRFYTMYFYAKLMHLPQMHECNAKFLLLLFTEDFRVKAAKNI